MAAAAAGGITAAAAHHLTTHHHHHHHGGTHMTFTPADAGAAGDGKAGAGAEAKKPESPLPPPRPAPIAASKVVELPPYRFDPQGPYKKPWDVVLMGVIMYSVVLVPYRIASGDEATGAMLIVDILFDVFFACDIVFNFLTCYPDPLTCELETDFKKIAVNYIKGWFFIDFFSTLPMDVVAKPFINDASNLRGAKLLRSLRLIKLVRLSRLMKLDALVDTAADAMGLNPKYLVLVSLSLNQFFIAHLLACIWLGIASPRSNDGCQSENAKCADECKYEASWIMNKELQCNTPVEQYMVALYWAFATMTTVGYGDVTAGNDSERLVSIFLMLVGVTIFGYTILMVALVIADGDPRSALSKAKMARANMFLNQYSLPTELRERARLHFTELVAQREASFSGEDLIDFLDPHTRAHTYCDAALPWQRRFEKVCVGLSKAAMAEIYNSMRLCSFLAEEAIFQKGDLGTQMYFVIRGRVKLVRDKVVCGTYGGQDGPAGEGDAFASRTNGEVFGEVSVLTGAVRQYSAVAGTRCICAFAPKEEIEVACQVFPHLWKNMLGIASETMESYNSGKTVEFRMSRYRPSITSKAAVAPEGMEAEEEEMDLEDEMSAEVWSRARELLFTRGLFHPSVPPKIVWDLLVGFFIVYSVLIVPYRIGFDAPPEGAASVFDAIGDIIFGLDILVAFRTSFLDQESGALVTDTCAIAKNYLKGWFTIDFLSTFPVDHVSAMAGGADSPASRSLKLLRVLRLFRLLKLLRLFKLKRLFGSYANRIYIPPVISDFFKNLLLLVFFAHLYCCLWYYSSGMPKHDCKTVSTEECAQLFAACCDDSNGTSLPIMIASGNHTGERDLDSWNRYGCDATGFQESFVNCSLWDSARDTPATWVTNYGPGPDGLSWSLWPYKVTPALDDVSDKYLAALYWTYATFLSVGYGDLTATLNPLSSSEVVTSLFGMCLGTICFAMFLSAVCEMVRQAVENSQYKEIITRMRDVLAENLVGKSLIVKVKEQFLHYIELRPLQYSTRQMYYELPLILRNQIVARQHGGTGGLLTQPFFADLEVQFPGFVGEVSHLLAPCTATPGECFISRGDTFRHMYFLLKGTVELFDKDDKMVGQVHAGSKCPVFGQACLAVKDGIPFKSKLSAFASTDVKLVVMSQGQFGSLGAISPALRKAIWEILQPARQKSKWIIAGRSRVPKWPGDGMM